MSTGSEGEVWAGLWVEGRGWTATLGTDPSVCDSRSSRRLVFCLCWSTMVEGMAEGTLGRFWLTLTWAVGNWEKGAKGDLAGEGWSKTLKSSSVSSLESTTSTTLVAFSFGTGFEEVVSSSGTRWIGSSTVWVPTGGVLVRKPGTATLIWCSQGSFAFITYLGAWKLVDMGL